MDVASDILLVVHTRHPPLSFSGIGTRLFLRPVLVYYLSYYPKLESTLSQIFKSFVKRIFYFA